MKQKKNIWLHRTRITGLILCTLLVAAYWGLFFYKIAANLPEYYCSMIQHTFLGWFRYVLLALQPLLAAATVFLLLIPKTNLIGLFLAFFLFSILTTMHGLAWSADWVSPDLLFTDGHLAVDQLRGDIPFKKHSKHTISNRLAMKTNTKAFIVSHIVVFMTGVAIAAAVFHREDPSAYQQPMFTYEEADEGCGCPDSLGEENMVEADTLWIKYKPAKR